MTSLTHLRTRLRVATLLAGTTLAITLAAAGTTAQAAPSAPDGGSSRLSADALVSATGAVVTPAQGAASVAAHQGTRVQGTAPFSGKASPGTAKTDSIIGPDGRTRVTATTTYPYRANVLILRNGSLHCTGWMISKDTMLTAGHCVHTGGSGGTWYTGLTFKPASNGGTAPYGTYTSRGTYALNGWVNSGSSDYDAAIVKLSGAVGTSTGWFGMWWQTAALDGTFTRVTGYPGDKPSTQWMSTGSVRSSQTNRVFYQNDTTGGNSGSPVWLFRGTGAPFCSGGPCAMAIHTNGLGSLSSTDNSGTRITEAKFNTFMSIVNLP